MNIKGLATLTFGLIILLSYPMVAQDVDINNLKNINVDELSDDQIQQFADEVKKRGLTQQQLELIAKSRGVSSYQISKLRQRIAALEIGDDRSNLQSGERLRSPVNTGYSEVEPIDSNEQDLFSSLTPDEQLENEIYVFGMGFFTNPSLTFEPNLNIPTPQNYILGPGDQIFIDVWGASEQSYQLTISPEGVIIVPSLGPISLAGLNVESASRRIKARLKSIYSGLNTNTYAQVSLGQIRSIKVNVVGEVAKPGTYTMSSFATVLNALYYAGGPSENGSLRQVDIMRNGKFAGSVDIYNFLLGRDQTVMQLQDQDLIIVRPYVARILIEGEVKRPGIYEILDSESIGDVISFSGGFSDNAYRSKVTVRRNNQLKRSILTVESDFYNEFAASGGDEIFVSEIISRFENRVQINGAVNKPGEYELTEGLSLKELIESAEGLTGDAFLGRGVIVRLKNDQTLSNLSFKLSEVMAGNNDPIKLKNEDYIVIQSMFDLKEDHFVNIQGEVNSPGKYTFIDSMTVEDIIYLANGFKESAAKSFVEVARRVNPNNVGDPSESSRIFTFKVSKDLSISDETSTFKLQPFDLVVIRKSPNYSEQEIVEVEGEVNFPGKYSLEKKDERISDLLNRAGGITEYGYVLGATLIRRTEYYVDEEEAAEGARLRRESLQTLSERDSTLSAAEFEIKQKESIGINLESIIKEPGSKYDLILEEGDVLSIPKQLQTVRLRGELLYPSTVRYDKANSFRDYISQAGGYGVRAKKNKAYVIYANGSVSTTRGFLWFKNYPKLAPGAEIIVPKKTDRQPLSAQAWIALASSAATLALAIQSLVN